MTGNLNSALTVNLKIKFNFIHCHNKDQLELLADLELLAVLEDLRIGAVTLSLFHSDHTDTYV